MSASGQRTQFKFTITMEVDLEFIRDILVTAVEGGINYWAAVTDYSPDNVYADIVDQEDSNEKWKIGRSTIERGIKRIMNGSVDCNSTIKGYIYDGLRNKDSGEIDADAADAIIQAGLFNELVYG